MAQEYDKNGAIFLYDAYDSFINGAVKNYASKPFKRTSNHLYTTNRKKKPHFYDEHAFFSEKWQYVKALTFASLYTPCTDLSIWNRPKTDFRVCRELDLYYFRLNYRKDRLKKRRHLKIIWDNIIFCKTSSKLFRNKFSTF